MGLCKSVNFRVNVESMLLRDQIVSVDLKKKPTLALY